MVHGMFYTKMIGDMLFVLMINIHKGMHMDLFKKSDNLLTIIKRTQVGNL